MPSRILPLSILAVLTVVSGLQHAWYWPQLPERVATHFGIDGQPNDWMARTPAVLTLCGLQIGVPLFLIALTSLASCFPDSLMNMPHREYWQNPDRRAASLAWMNAMLAWVAVASCCLMAILAHLTFVANITGAGLDTIWFLAVLVAYLVSVLSMAGRSLWRFRRPEAT